MTLPPVKKIKAPVPGKGRRPLLRYTTLCSCQRTNIRPPANGGNRLRLLGAGRRHRWGSNSGGIFPCGDLYRACTIPGSLRQPSARYCLHLRFFHHTPKPEKSQEEKQKFSGEGLFRPHRTRFSPPVRLHRKHPVSPLEATASGGRLYYSRIGRSLTRGSSFRYFCSISGR